VLAVPELDAAPRLWVGAEGLLVEEVVWSNPLPVVGVVEGMGAVTADWREAKLAPKLMSSIGREVVALWSEFARSVAVDGPRAHRDILTAVALRLAAADATSMAADALALRGQLKRMPLLPANSGGFVSIDDAVERRPAELLPLLVRHGLLHKDVLRAPAPTTTAPPTRESAAATTGVPEASPPPMTDAMKLRLRIVDEIRLIRRPPHQVLLDVEIDRIQVFEGRGKSLLGTDHGNIVVDVKHPLCTAALASTSALFVLVVAVVGALNALLESFSDEEERSLLLALARYAQTARPSDDGA